MTFTITTNVAQPYLIVAKGFDIKLFESLSPPFPRVKVLRFDGCKKDDLVSIEMNFLVLKQRWDAVIVEQEENENEWYFIDEGKLLPKPLKYWRHKHCALPQINNTTNIVDIIQYKTNSKILDILFFPLFYLQFLMRVPIYKKYFSK